MEQTLINDNNAIVMQFSLKLAATAGGYSGLFYFLIKSILFIKTINLYN